jgi:hypothetical protein
MHMCDMTSWILLVSISLLLSAKLWRKRVFAMEWSG